MALGHSKLIFSFCSPTHDCYRDSIYEDYMVISVNFPGRNYCCVVLKGAEWSFLHSQAFHIPVITLYVYYCDVIKQQVNFVIHDASDCGY